MDEISELKKKPFRIYSEFGDNVDLKKALNKIAKELHFEVYFGSGWDFIATYFNIAILNRMCLDPEAWEFYISSEMVDEFSSEFVILADNQAAPYIPPFYNINQVDPSSQEGIEHIIGLVRSTHKLMSLHRSA